MKTLLVLIGPTIILASLDWIVPSLISLIPAKEDGDITMPLTVCVIVLPLAMVFIHALFTLNWEKAVVPIAVKSKQE